MSDDMKRVLGRRGARELTAEEASFIAAGACPNPKMCTLTLCSITANGTVDGDVNEC